MSYHISPETGRPNKCRATKQCPLGGTHYATKEEARAGYEQEQSLPGSMRKYGTYDNAVLPGMAIKGESLYKSQARLEATPVLTMEPVEQDGQTVTMIHANGKPLVEARDSRQVQDVHRIVDAGQWPALQEVLDRNPDTLDDLSHYMTWTQEDLETEIRDYEEVEANALLTRTPLEREATRRTIELHRTALAVVSAEAKTKK